MKDKVCHAESVTSYFLSFIIFNGKKKKGEQDEQIFGKT